MGTSNRQTSRNNNGRTPLSNEYERLVSTPVFSNSMSASSSQACICRNVVIFLGCISMCCCTSFSIALYMSVSRNVTNNENTLSVPRQETSDIVSTADNQGLIENRRPAREPVSTPEPLNRVFSRQRPSILLKMAALVRDDASNAHRHLGRDNVSISKVFPKWLNNNKADAFDLYESEVIKDMIYAIATLSRRSLEV